MRNLFIGLFLLVSFYGQSQYFLPKYKDALVFEKCTLAVQLLEETNEKEKFKNDLLKVAFADA